ncbi:MAG: ABC transporter permease [Bacteroidota bacterium]
MLRNYFKLGWRNLLNQKLPSFINISGLALAIACCMNAYLFIESVWLRGMHHENKDNIYELTHHKKVNSEEIHAGNMASPIAKWMEDYHEIEDVTRVNTAQLVIKYKNDNFSVNTFQVDPAYLNIFTHNVILGNKSALNDPYQVVITESTSNLFFKDSYPIGEPLQINLNGELVEFTIGAVIEDHTSVAMFHFELLMNNYHLSKSNLNIDENWKVNSWTFLQLKDGLDVTEISGKFQNLIATQNENRPEEKYTSLELVPFMELTQRSDEIEGGAGNGAGLAPQIVLSCIGLFLLLLAVFNYINIAILMATKRVKEIGVRKVIGGRKRQLVIQFLSENLITCFISLVMGLIIAHTLFIPWFNNMANTNLGLKFD